MKAPTLAVALLLALAVGARADFGEAVVYEAVDLAEAHPADAAEEARSMESLLHWAIANSNTEELARRAEEVRQDTLLQDLKQQLEERRARVRELRSYMDAQVTETQLIKDALAVLAASNSSSEERLAALQELQPLVEPIDNANDLKPLGGIPLIVEHLLYRNQASGSAGGSSDSSSSGGSDASAPTPPPPPPPSLASPLPPTPAARAATAQSKALAAEIRTAAAYVIGSAASNNVRFQADLLEAFPDIFDTLLELCLDPVEEVGVKGTYAVAAMVRNLQQAHTAFVRAGGYGVLQRLLAGADVSVRVKRKALSLLMDLSHVTQPQGQQLRLATHQGLMAATLQLLGTGDLDMAEKALEALQSLLQGGDAAVAAANLREADAGSKLAALQVELGEAQRAEDDPYLTYLLQLCQRTRQLLDQAPALTPEQQQQEAERQQEQAATGAGTGAGGEAAGEAGAKGVSGGRASRRRKASGTADPSGAADPYPDEPVLQLGGHVEL